MRAGRQARRGAAPRARARNARTELGMTLAPPLGEVLMKFCEVRERGSGDVHGDRCIRYSMYMAFIDI